VNAEEKKKRTRNSSHRSLKIASKRLDLKILSKSSLIMLLYAKMRVLLSSDKYHHISWTPYAVHTLNLALKNIRAAKNTEANVVPYAQRNWITEVSDDVMMIKNFIMNHSMRLIMFNEYSKMNLLAIAETRFASWIIILKRFKVIKRNLQDMIS